MIFHVFPFISSHFIARFHSSSAVSHCEPRLAKEKAQEKAEQAESDAELEKKQQAEDRDPSREVEI